MVSIRAREGESGGESEGVKRRRTDNDDPGGSQRLRHSSAKQPNWSRTKDGDDLSRSGVGERRDRVDSDGEGLDHRSFFERDGGGQVVR